MENHWNNSYHTTWNYKKTTKLRYSAGILPYTFDQNGKCFFLLGKDHENDWSDFGGRCEFKDNSEPLNTASREFYEETLGAIIGIKECTDKINNVKNPIRIISKTLNGSPYHMFLLYIDYSINYMDTFNKTLAFLKYHYEPDRQNKIIEKTCIRWVSMDTLLNCLENRQNNPISLRGVFYKTLDSCKDQLQLLIK